MKNLKMKLLSHKIAIAIIGILALVGSVYAYSGSAPKYVVEGDMTVNEAPEVQEGSLGANPGPEKYQRQYFYAGYNTGGETLATSSDTANYTMVPAEIDQDIYYISWTPNLNITVTLPATTTPGFNNIVSTVVGDTREYILYNASTSVGTITLAAGTGIDLQKNEDTADLATAALAITKLTFIRKADSDVLVIMDQYDTAD